MQTKNRRWLSILGFIPLLLVLFSEGANYRATTKAEQAKQDYAAHNFQAAELSARSAVFWSSLSLWPTYKATGTYDGNMVLGRLALQSGNIGEAEKFLLASGTTHGSPQLNSFGPNMSLAKELLERGDKQPVLAFFEECRSFWKSHPEMLDAWSEQVRKGEIPEFGANLKY